MDKTLTPEKIRKIRRKLGLTQSGLADVLGYRQYQTVNRWETGRVAIPLRAQKALLTIHKLYSFATNSRKEMA